MKIPSFVYMMLLIVPNLACCQDGAVKERELTVRVKGVDGVPLAGANASVFFSKGVKANPGGAL